MDSRVKSSEVGPKPPVVITISDLDSDSDIHRFISVNSSPILVTLLSVSPSLGNSEAINVEFESMSSPMSSSVPIAIISTYVVTELFVSNISSQGGRILKRYSIELRKGRYRIILAVSQPIRTG